MDIHRDALDDALGDLNRSTNRLRRKFEGRRRQESTYSSTRKAKTENARLPRSAERRPNEI
jgi:hypothetical protein